MLNMPLSAQLLWGCLLAFIGWAWLEAVGTVCLDARGAGVASLEWFVVDGRSISGNSIGFAGGDFAAAGV